MKLDNVLRNIVIGDSMITNYCNRIKTIVDLLESVDCISRKRTSLCIINILSMKFNYGTSHIRHCTLLPSLLETRSMFLLEEQRNQVDRRNASGSHIDHSSQPIILATEQTSPTIITSTAHNLGGLRGHNSRDAVEIAVEEDMVSTINRTNSTIKNA